MAKDLLLKLEVELTNIGIVGNGMAGNGISGNGISGNGVDCCQYDLVNFKKNLGKFLSK